MSDSDDFDLSDDEMADEGTAATVPLRPLHASRAAPPRCWLETCQRAGRQSATMLSHGAGEGEGAGAEARSEE